MIPPTPTTLTTMPGSKAKIGFSIDSIVGDEVSKSNTTTTKDRTDKYVNDYQTEIARALRLSSDSFGVDGHMKFRPDLNGASKEARHLFGYSMKRESSLSPLAPYQTQSTLPSEEQTVRKSRSPSPNPAANALTNNNNTNSNNNNNSNSNNNNLHSSGSNTNNNEPPVVPPITFTVSSETRSHHFLSHISTHCAS